MNQLVVYLYYVYFTLTVVTLDWGLNFVSDLYLGEDVSLSSFGNFRISMGPQMQFDARFDQRVSKITAKFDIVYRGNE